MARYSGSKLHGTWMITEVQGHTADDTSFDNLKGIEFTLEKGGSAQWKNEFNLDFPPSFCDTYEVHSSSFSTFIRFAGFKGNIIEFRVERPSSHDLVLSFDSWIIFICKKVVVKNQHTSLDNSFSLVPALEEGYFSDLELHAANSQTFQVHKTILSLSQPDFEWESLNGLPEPVLSTALHFAYSHHLPSTFNSQTAQLCIDHFQNHLPMKSLLDQCRSFLKNHSVRNEIRQLVQSIHSSLDKMISLFESSNEADMLVNAARLWQSVKLSLGEGVVAVIRFIQLCVTFTRHKTDLTSEERREVVTYFRARLPIFVSQIYRLLKCFRNVIGSLSASQTFVLASYIAPEVDGALTVIWSLAIECKNLTEQIIYSFRSLAPTGHRMADSLLDKETLKLKNLHEKLMLAVMFLSHKKEKFAEMNVSSQVRSVMRNINLFVEEIPLVIFRLEEIIASLDVSLSFAEFHFTFYSIASKINQTISRLKEIKTEPNVRALLQQICELVQREELNASLITLELIENTSSSATSPPAPSSTEPHGADSLPLDGDLSRVGPLCREPMASQSPLARNVLHLLESEINSDLDFILPADPETGQVDQVVKAHRVILAARCRWFYRALLSGMREAIDRKITLPDCSPPLLSLFLRFLYGDHLDHSSISNDNCIELLILADRFEVEQLSVGCQAVLSSRLDNSNVLCFLAVADQVATATQLQESCVNFIWKHGDSIDKEGIEELPAHLRSQVQLHTSNPHTSRNWMNLPVHAGESYLWGRGSSDRSSTSSRSSSTSSTNSSSSKESVDLLQELTNEMRIAVAEAEQEQQEQRLENCVAALEDILVEVSRPELLRLALAADCDINRAVNYYLAQPDPSINAGQGCSK